MSLINRFEVANFLNLDNLPPSHMDWKPDHIHTTLNFRGNNTAIVATNGVGKSTMNFAFYAILLMDKHFKIETKKRAAPKRSGAYSHIRVELLYHDKPPAPLFGTLGMDVPGEPYVLGSYSNSDGDFAFYAYQGYLEDCPVATNKKGIISITSNQDFRETLKNMPGLLNNPVRDEWLHFVGKHFNMSLLAQLAAYQKDGGADSTEDFFKVKCRRSDGRKENYDAAFFYEHFAPEVLAKAMRGERDDEDRFEETILNSASPIIKAEIEFDKSQIKLDKHRETFSRLESVNSTLEELTRARQRLDKITGQLSGEVNFILDITKNDPLLGIPCELHEKAEKTRFVANRMVVAGGKWLIPDRLLAEMWGSDVRQVNEAAERAGKKGDRIRQAIEILCDFSRNSSRPQGGEGKLNQAYDIDVAISLTAKRTKFADGWSREDAERALRDGFSYRLSHGEANPMRTKVTDLSDQIAVITDKFEQAVKDGKEAKEKLRSLDACIVSLKADEYELLMLQNSGLFSTDEFANLIKTGRMAQESYDVACAELKDHEHRNIALKDDRSGFKAFCVKWPKSQPKDVLTSLKENVSAAALKVEDACKALSTAKTSLTACVDERKRLDDVIASKQQEQFKLNALTQSVERYEAIFSGTDPEGLENAVKAAHSDAQTTLGGFQVRRSILHAEQKDLLAGASLVKSVMVAFEGQFGNIAPRDLLKERSSRLEAALHEKSKAEESMSDTSRQLEDLSGASVAAGRIANEVLGVAGAAIGGQVRRVHEIVDDVLSKDDKRRKLVLTHFSHVLHAPVAETETDAHSILLKLEQEGIEAPVFWREGLVSFCKDVQFAKTQDVTTSLLAGCMTLQVEGLFDPHSVVKRRQQLKDKVERLSSILGALSKEIDDLNSNSFDGLLIRIAIDAVSVVGLPLEIPSDIDLQKTGLDKVAQAISSFLERGSNPRLVEVHHDLDRLEQDKLNLKKMLPELETRANAMADIRDACEFKRLGGAEAFIRLREVIDAEGRAHIKSCEDEETAKMKVDDATINMGDAEKVLSEGKLDLANAHSVLHQAQSYLEKGGDAFDQTYLDVLSKYQEAVARCKKCVSFRFENASRALAAEQRGEGAISLETKRSHLQSEITATEDQKDALNKKERYVREDLHKSQQLMDQLDRVSLGLIKCRRDALQTLQDTNLTSSIVDSIESIALKKARSFLPDIRVDMADAELNSDVAIFASAIERMDDLEQETKNFSLLSQLDAIKEARSTKNTSLKTYIKSVDSLRVDKTVTLAESERILLGEALEEKGNSRIPELLKNFEHHVAESEKRYESVKSELSVARERLSTNLDAFTLAAESNFRLLKSCLKPKLNGSELIEAGFEIKASIIGRDGIRSAIGKIVDTIRSNQQERSDQADKNVIRVTQKDFDDRMKKEIRGVLYRSIFTGDGATEEHLLSPRIFLRHPNIGGGRRIQMDQKVSTGQSNALVLLLLIKMADFSMSRDAQYDLSGSGRRKSNTTQTRVVMIDGLFSNVSNRELIRESLASLRSMKNKFQLIGWIHNEHYENDPDIFPSHIGIRRVGANEGYAVVNDMLGEGNVGVLEMHIDPLPDDQKVEPQ